MLNVNTIEVFFTRHNIPLMGEEFRHAQNIDKLFLDAYSICKSFGAFVLYTIVNADKTGIKTVFNTYADVEEMYTYFLIGYSKHTNN